MQTVSDPVNGISNPKAIPGAVMLYTINVSNQGAGAVDSDTMVITETVPTGSELFVDTSGGDPVAFTDGPVVSGLTYSYAGDVTFSNQPGGGPPYSYSPTPNALGYDPLVTGFRINPGWAGECRGRRQLPEFQHHAQRTGAVGSIPLRRRALEVRLAILGERRQAFAQVRRVDRLFHAVYLHLQYLLETRRQRSLTDGLQAA